MVEEEEEKKVPCSVVSVSYMTIRECRSNGAYPYRIQGILSVGRLLNIIFYYNRISRH
jgi:hypothetical protein